MSVSLSLSLLYLFRLVISGGQLLRPLVLFDMIDMSEDIFGIEIYNFLVVSRDIALQLTRAAVLTLSLLSISQWTSYR